MRLFASTRRLAAKHGRQRPPRSLQSLPTPRIHRSWGNIADLSTAEKTELLHGGWRQSTPIQLVTDKSDRDGGGFTEPVAFTTDEDAQRFLKEEDEEDVAEQRESTLALAQRFFVELAAAADEELDASAMPPAPQSDEERRQEQRDVQRHFFADFYREQRLITEEQRYAFVDAMLRPSRALFLVNSTLPLVRLTVRDQLESHQRVVETTHNTAPSPSSSSSSLSMPSAAAPVFEASELDACLYSVPVVPTQAIGAALHTSFTAATTLTDPSADAHAAATSRDELEGGAATHESLQKEMEAEEKTEAIADADVLSAMLQDDSDDVALDDKCDGERGVATRADSIAAASAPSVTAPALPAPLSPSLPLVFRPPTLAHMYWLQRQVASNALLNIDVLSHAISLLSVRLAAHCAMSAEQDDDSSDRHHLDSHNGESHCGSYATIVYQADTSVPVAERAAASSSYHNEIAHYLFRALEEAKAEEGSAEAQLLQRVVVVVEDATYYPARSAATRKGQSTRGARTPASLRREQRESLSPPLPCDGSAVPIADRYPSVVYVSPTLSRSSSSSFFTPSQPTTTHETTPRRAPRHPARLPLRGNVVVCVPLTSQDGVRPRAWLSSGVEDGEEDGEASRRIAEEEKDNTTAAAAAADGGSKRMASLTNVAPPNNFIDRCRLANDNFTRLQQQLYSALCAVDVRCGGERRDASCTATDGWVLYATQSMNVMENEAVVCAVLRRVAEEQKAGCGAEGPARVVTCVPLASSALRACVRDELAWDSLQRFCDQGRSGLAEWVAIEGGSAAQEAESYDAELRAAVAQASLRLDPLRSGSDGGFVICLRVSSSPPPASTTNLIGVAPTASPQSSASSVVRHTDPPADGDTPGASHDTARVHDSHAGESVCWWKGGADGGSLLYAVTPAVRRFLEGTSAGRRRKGSGSSSIHNSSRAEGRPGYAFTLLHPGVPVGLAASGSSTSVATAVAEVNAHCPLSSAAAHADVLCALRRALPELQVSAVALDAFLRLKHVSSRAVHYQLRLLHKQLQLPSHRNQHDHPNSHQNPQRQELDESHKGVFSSESLTDALERELRAFLVAVEDVIARAEQVSVEGGVTSSFTQRRLSLVVAAAPQSLVPPGSPTPLTESSAGTTPTTTAAIAAEAHALHPAVAAELQAACVVAQLNFTRRTAKTGRTSTAQAGEKGVETKGGCYDFTLSLSVPAEMAERAKHEAALEEWRVALRDALSYVGRRTGAASSELAKRLFQPAQSPTLGDEGVGATGGGGDGVRVPTGYEEDVELTEEEYETTTAATSHMGGGLRNGRVASAPVDLFAESHGFSSPQAGGGSGDWMEDTNYRAWRRRRTQGPLTR